MRVDSTLMDHGILGSGGRLRDGIEIPNWMIGSATPDYNLESQYYSPQCIYNEYILLVESGMGVIRKDKLYVFNSRTRQIIQIPGDISGNIISATMDDSFYYVHAGNRLCKIDRLSNQTIWIFPTGAAYITNDNISRVWVDHESNVYVLYTISGSENKYTFTKVDEDGELILNKERFFSKRILWDRPYIDTENECFYISYNALSRYNYNCELVSETPILTGFSDIVDVTDKVAILFRRDSYLNSILATDIDSLDSNDNIYQITLPYGSDRNIVYDKKNKTLTAFMNISKTVSKYIDGVLLYSVRLDQIFNHQYNLLFSGYLNLLYSPYEGKIYGSFGLYYLNSDTWGRALASLYDSVIIRK